MSNVTPTPAKPQPTQTAQATSSPLSDVGKPRLVALVASMLSLHEEISDCETCSQNLECLAELIAAGKQPADALATVQQHIQCCSDCREEFDALLKVIIAQNCGEC